MNEREQFTFWSRHLAIDGIRKLILSSAPVQGRKRAADRETFAHCDETGFPRWIGIGNTVARRNDVPSYAALVETASLLVLDAPATSAAISYGGSRKGWTKRPRGILRVGPLRGKICPRSDQFIMSNTTVCYPTTVARSFFEQSS
jgi:hypothetical protein